MTDTGMTEEQRDALSRHGYNPDAPPRGVAGGPGPVYSTRIIDGRAEPVWLRNRVCMLDGILIDGHEGSDLDPGSTACIHCDHQGPNP